LLLCEKTPRGCSFIRAKRKTGSHAGERLWKFLGRALKVFVKRAAGEGCGDREGEVFPSRHRTYADGTGKGQKIGRRKSPVSGPFISGRFLSYLFSLTPWLSRQGMAGETEKVWRKNIPFPERNTITCIERFF